MAQALLTGIDMVRHWTGTGPVLRICFRERRAVCRGIDRFHDGTMSLSPAHVNVTRPSSTRTYRHIHIVLEESLQGERRAFYLSLSLFISLFISLRGWSVTVCRAQDGQQARWMRGGGWGEEGPWPENLGFILVK